MIHLDSTQMRRSGVLADAVTGLEHTVAGTAQVHERGEGLHHEDPVCLRPHRVQRRHQLMHETRRIVTNNSRDTKQ